MDRWESLMDRFVERLAEHFVDRLADHLVECLEVLKEVLDPLEVEMALHSLYIIHCT